MRNHTYRKIEGLTWKDGKPASFNNKPLVALRAKVAEGIAIANAAEAKAEPILRNMSEAKAGLERAMNIF
jgi:hypothetical protein